MQLGVIAVGLIYRQVDGQSFPEECRRILVT